MSLSSRSSDNKSNHPQNSIRAWPLFAISFIRLFYVSIFERALQNYLYFNIGISESTLGSISSAGAIAYIFAPLIGQQITKKTGIRNALILSAVLTPFLTFAQTIFFEAWYLITIRVFLGLVIGLNWPNCFNLLSNWQKISSPHQTKKFFNYFNFSWNSGFIGGLLVGYLWAFVWSDYLAMMISFCMSFLLIPFSFFLQKVPKGGYREEIPIEQVIEKLPPVKEDHDPKIETMMLAFPVLFSWISLVILSITKSTIMFSYPVFIKSFDENLSDLTYLVQAGIQIGQVMGLTVINSINPPKRKFAALFSVLTLSAIASSFLVFRNILMITILSMASGLFFGLLHGVSMKIMLDYGTAKNTTKYSTLNEIIIGMGFGLTPIIAGYVAEVDIYLMYAFIVFLGIGIFFFLCYLSRNVKWNKVLNLKNSN